MCWWKQLEVQLWLKIPNFINSCFCQWEMCDCSPKHWHQQPALQSTLKKGGMRAQIHGFETRFSNNHCTLTPMPMPLPFLLEEHSSGEIPAHGRGCRSSPWQHCCTHMAPGTALSVLLWLYQSFNESFSGCCSWPKHGVGITSPGAAAGAAQQCTVQTGSNTETENSQCELCPPAPGASPRPQRAEKTATYFSRPLQTWTCANFFCLQTSRGKKPTQF